MLLKLKVAMIERGIRQSRMAVELGWDPAKVSRIVNQIQTASLAERVRIARYLDMNQKVLFTGEYRPSDSYRMKRPRGRQATKPRSTF